MCRARCSFVYISFIHHKLCCALDRIQWGLRPPKHPEGGLRPPLHPKNIIINFKLSPYEHSVSRTQTLFGAWIQNNYRRCLLRASRNEKSSYDGPLSCCLARILQYLPCPKLIEPHTSGSGSVPSACLYNELL